MNQKVVVGAPNDQNQQAMRAMAAGDFAAAREILKKALLQARGNNSLWLNLAACCRALAEPMNALAALDEALKVNPRSFRAMLMKGSLLEQLKEARRMAVAYDAAIALAPADDTLDAPTANALAHARSVQRAYRDELANFINAELGLLKEKGGSAESRRVQAFVDLSIGRKQAYNQQPTELRYPGLPAIQFWEPEQFPWMESFERATASIRSELIEILRDDFRDFVPYVEYPQGVPLDQWQALNHSSRWGALHLFKYGERVESNCRRCPETVGALSALPQPHIRARSPAAMFSALQPKTRIPPHTGVANTRLVVHLPLIVPEGCGFRVGNETRPWREAQAWVFDDTIEHEAWNDSDRPRVILICDIWNPLLSQTERELIGAVMVAMDKFSGAAPADSL
jgi:aspartate beta-hydroxylase